MSEDTIQLTLTKKDVEYIDIDWLIHGRLIIKAEALKSKKMVHLRYVFQHVDRWER